MASNSEDEENYIESGTAVDPLDGDAPPRKKPVSLEDQVVKDSQGRRRFHGAFTGGFSAGFFNSVGSLEGWTPSSFRSSRSERADKKTQNPQDFMDDEDVGEFGIAPNVLRVTSDFCDDRKNRKRSSTHLSDGPIPGKPAFEEIFQTVRETVGIKLLRRMGWKPGQGVGPRLTSAEKKLLRQERKKSSGKIYGCLLPNGSYYTTSDSDSSDEEYIKNLTFAPDDFEDFLCKPKNNWFGIGYNGLEKRPILSRHISLFEPSSLVMNEKKRKVSISGQAFGVGALEEDDEDIYAHEDMTQYDFSLEKTSASPIKELQSPQSAFDSYAGEILEGFLHGTKTVSKKKYFLPPELPAGFQPLHIIKRSCLEPVKSPMCNAMKKGLQRHTLSASDRALVLNQSAVTSPVQSQEPNREDEEKKRLSAEAFKITEKLLPGLFKGTNQFQPFAGYPEKQKRYEQYLVLVNTGQKECLANLQPLDMTEWEKDREQTEFDKAVKLFRPLSGDMSDRFVTAMQPDDTTNPLAAVEILADANVEEKLAVKMKMFGQLTRERTGWQPCSLLCRRFNIAEPSFSEGSASAATATPVKSSRFSVFDYLDSSVLNIPSQELTMETKTKAEEDGKEGSQPSIDLENEMTFPDPPEKIDLYKAIFLSSSEESAPEEEPEPPVVAPNNNNTATLYLDIPLPPPTDQLTHQNTSPPRGVFANLDLGALNTRKPVQPEKPPSHNEPESGNQVQDKALIEDDVQMYGPKLPSIPFSPAPVPIRRSVPSSVIAPREWVEKYKKRSHKSKHHKRNHKKSVKHKSKKKKKHK